MLDQEQTVMQGISGCFQTCGFNHLNLCIFQSYVDKLLKESHENGKEKKQYSMF